MTILFYLLEDATMGIKLNDLMADDEEFDAFEDIGGGDGPLTSTSPTDDPDQPTM